MFRNEPKLSPLHSYEFTVADIYEVGDKENVKKKFIAILKQLEKDLRLRPLSKEFVEINYNDSFNNISEKECWILVNNYPREESFYDVDNENGTTKKFELFYKNNKKVIEIVACGELGENVNPNNFIKNKDSIVQKEPLKKGFVGFGIGIERLLLLYSTRQK
jgi:aspartyl/asparaginyl-tRNA synthetase